MWYAIGLLSVIVLILQMQARRADRKATRLELKLGQNEKLWKLQKDFNHKVDMEQHRYRVIIDKHTKTINNLKFGDDYSGVYDKILDD